VLRLLHNPRYAGVFIYGRTRCRMTIDSETQVQHLPREQWHAFVADSHPAYISWEEHEHNQRRLRENAHAQRSEREKSPAREGPALLQGLIVSGRCGRRMTVRYHWRRSGLAMPCLRHNSAVSKPASDSFKIPTICSSVYRLFRI
jgi:hypothetical protein